MCELTESFPRHTVIGSFLSFCFLLSFIYGRLPTAPPHVLHLSFKFPFLSKLVSHLSDTVVFFPSLLPHSSSHPATKNSDSCAEFLTVTYRSKKKKKETHSVSIATHSSDVLLWGQSVQEVLR